VLAWLQLFRLPNVFTAIADVAMGFLVVHELPPRAIPLALVVAASSLLYTAGMVLNDLFDYEVDRDERPQRPLPSGRISRQVARSLGWGMLFAGAALAWGSGPRAGGLAAGLALAIVLYDAVLKATWLGPVAMGACRLLNVAMGMAAAQGGAGQPAWGWEHGLIAAGIGVYIVGVTLLARFEAETSPRGGLLAGALVMAAGIGLLAAFPNFRSAGTPFLLASPLVWIGLLVLLTLSVFRRCVLAIVSPQPQYVQLAVKQSILTLIVLDGAICLAVRGPACALAILVLLVPSLSLGRWVYST
jgi:4-hydroxybenzoate polyprenyltransferase